MRGGHEVWLQRECVPHVCSVKLIATGESQNLKFRAASANAVSLANSDESLFMISVKFMNFAEIRSRSKKKYTKGTKTGNETIPESY